MKLKLLAVIGFIIAFSGSAIAQPPPPEPEDIFSLFGLPLDSSVGYVALALVLYGAFSLRKNFKLSAIKIFAK